MLKFEEEIRATQVYAAAQQMLIAARTAPKARGIDHLILALISKETIALVSKQIRKKYDEMGETFLLRDAENVLKAECVVLLGSKNVVLGLHCGYCGFSSCTEKMANSPAAPCVFNTHDLGVAVGSAVATASNLHVDNRVMYSVGAAAMELGLLGNDCVCAFGIPLSVGSKNPFFDRPNPYIPTEE